MHVARAARIFRGMNRSVSVARPARQRSAVTNGRRSFVVGDGNSPWARRHRDLAELYLDDLGPRETLSEAEVSLAKRAATLAVELEAMEGKLSMGEEVDLDLYSRVAGHLRRVHESLGIKRAARVVERNPILEHFSRPPERSAL